MQKIQKCQVVGVEGYEHSNQQYDKSDSPASKSSGFVSDIHMYVNSNVYPNQQTVLCQIFHIYGNSNVYQPANAKDQVSADCR